jgi:hypothetical protein
MRDDHRCGDMPDAEQLGQRGPRSGYGLSDTSVVVLDLGVQAGDVVEQIGGDQLAFQLDLSGRDVSVEQSGCGLTPTACVTRRRESDRLGAGAAG